MSKRIALALSVIVVVTLMVGCYGAETVTIWHPDLHIMMYNPSYSFEAFCEDYKVLETTTDEYGLLYITVIKEEQERILKNLSAEIDDAIAESVNEPGGTFDSITVSDDFDEITVTVAKNWNISDDITVLVTTMKTDNIYERCCAYQWFANKENTQVVRKIIEAGTNRVITTR